MGNTFGTAYGKFTQEVLPQYRQWLKTVYREFSAYLACDFPLIECDVAKDERARRAITHQEDDLLRPSPPLSDTQPPLFTMSPQASDVESASEKVTLEKNSKKRKRKGKQVRKKKSEGDLMDIDKEGNQQGVEGGADEEGTEHVDEEESAVEEESPGEKIRRKNAYRAKKRAWLIENAAKPTHLRPKPRPRFSVANSSTAPVSTPPPWLTPSTPPPSTPPITLEPPVTTQPTTSEPVVAVSPPPPPMPIADVRSVDSNVPPPLAPSLPPTKESAVAISPSPTPPPPPTKEPVVVVSPPPPPRPPSSPPPPPPSSPPPPPPSSPPPPPPLAPATNARPVDSNVPEWYTAALETLEKLKFGSDWSLCVALWMEIECHMEFDCSFVSLPTSIPMLANIPSQRGFTTKDRPSQVAWWIGRAHVYTKIPPITSHKNYRIQCMKWWNHIQPSWRKTTNLGDIMPLSVYDGQWEPLRRSGKNGILLVLMVFSWWGHEDSVSEDWIALMADLRVSLESILRELRGELTSGVVL
jgi:hypothetical protein